MNYKDTKIRDCIYEHGGSRIWREVDGEAGRDLLADTFHTKEFAEAVRVFTEEWIKEENMVAARTLYDHHRSSRENK